MRYLAVMALTLMSLLKLMSPTQAFDCSVSCPTGGEQFEIGGLNVLDNCELIAGSLGKQDPNSWCKANYVTTGWVRCDSCNSKSWGNGTCKRTTSTASTFPYTTTYGCATDSYVTNTIHCCNTIAPAACQGRCGNATCSIGSCVNNKCVNTDCPSDTDCVCGGDGGGDDPSCSVTVTGTSPVALGGTGTYTATVSMTDSTATGITMTLGEGGSTYTSSSVAGTNTVDLVAPLTTGAATVTATVTGTSSVSCTGTFPVTVANPKVNVGVRACNAPNMLTCDDCDEPVGFAGTFSLHSSTNPETTQTEPVFGNSLVTFSDVSGGSIPSNLTLTTPDPDWTLLGAAKSYPAGSWPTDGETYGPFDHCVTNPQLMAYWV